MKVFDSFSQISLFWGSTVGCLEATSQCKEADRGHIKGMMTKYGAVLAKADE